MEQSDIPVFIGKANGAKRHPGFLSGQAMIIIQLQQK